MSVKTLSSRMVLTKKRNIISASVNFLGIMARIAMRAHAMNTQIASDTAVLLNPYDGLICTFIRIDMCMYTMEISWTQILLVMQVSVIVYFRKLNYD